MKRKVVKQGAATLMVSLPSSWVKSAHIEKGQEVEVTQVGRELIITKSSIPQKKTVTLHFPTYNETFIQTTVINAYRAGYDKLEINFNEEATYKIICREIHDNTIGFDIVTRGKKYCIVENITEPVSDKFDAVIRKLFYSIQLLLNATEARLRHVPPQENYLDLVKMVNQYDNFCRRLVNKHVIFGEKSAAFVQFLTLLSYGQRELYHLNRFLDTTKAPFKDYQFYLEMKEIFRLLHESYVEKDLRKTEKIHLLQKKLIYTDYYRLVKGTRTENIVLHHIVSAVRNFYLATSPLTLIFS